MISSYMDISYDLAHVIVVMSYMDMSSDVAHVIVVMSYMDMSSDVAHVLVTYMDMYLTSYILLGISLVYTFNGLINPCIDLIKRL
jgi:hypothetical protein